MKNILIALSLIFVSFFSQAEDIKQPPNKKIPIEYKEMSNSLEFSLCMDGKGFQKPTNQKIVDSKFKNTK